MLIRPSIAASDTNMDQLRTEINGWFAELANTIEYVPRSGVVGRTTKPAWSRGAGDVYRVRHGFRERPDYILGGALPTTGAVESYFLSRSTDEEFSFNKGLTLVSDAVFVLLFLDRSLAKEAEQETTGSQIFSKKGSSQSKTQ